MCTVTCTPAGDRLLIVHSRDEKSIRPKAIKPREYCVSGHDLLFPRDTLAGGTWMAVNRNGAAAVLLNGAFEKHLPQPSYRKSRGLVLLDIIASGDIYNSWRHIDLRNIEPFTVVLWNKGLLYEGRWDGRQKHTMKLDASTAHTWSSVTLYTQAVIGRREQWFACWRQQHPQPSLQDIVTYHLSGGDGDLHNDLRMNREERMLTVSITATELCADRCRLQYLDLQDNTSYEHDFSLTNLALLT
jgi:hypothetical protein